jgi:hypothetical protein
MYHYHTPFYYLVHLINVMLFSCAYIGSTINEQKRFHHILDVAGLVDSWRALNGPKTAKRGIHAALYTWRGASGPRYYGKGMRIDYHLVSKCLLESGMVDTPDINGYGLDMEGFMVSFNLDCYSIFADCDKKQGAFQWSSDY